MTGMKEGAGGDPFAEDNESPERESIERRGSDNTQPDSGSQSETSDQQRSQQQTQIPYKFRRDGVQDGRNRVPLFIQEDTKRAEREALRELERQFDDNVSLTDLREALVKAGLEHLDEVEGHLEQWGYGMTFDK
jgi:hypothetical protein